MSKEWTREEEEASIQAFLAGGGEITHLRYADKKTVAKANRRAYHEDKALCGSQRSKRLLEQEKKKEASFIFSRTERFKVV